MSLNISVWRACWLKWCYTGLCCNGDKVKQDLKQRLRHVQLQDSWFDVEFLLQQTQQVLGPLPAGFASAVSTDLALTLRQHC